MKRKIYLDFDRTLFDTDAFIKDMNKVLEKDIDLLLFEEYKRRDEKKGFNPYRIIKMMNIDNKDEIYQNLDNLMNNVSKYLYPDTIPFLEKMQKEYDLYIFTYGDKDFQKRKVINTHIDKYINSFIDILDKKSNSLEINYQESIFIDDNPFVIDDILLKKPYMAIRMRRNKAKYSLINMKNKVMEVKSFEEINI